MTAIQCPRCSRDAVGGPGFWGDKKPYCPACGWNIDRANSPGGKNQKALAVYFVAIGIFLAAIGASTARTPNQHFGSFVAFGSILVVLALISWHRSKSQKSAPTATVSASPVSSASTATSSQVSAAIERLRFMSRPRAIRFKKLMRFFAVIYALVFAGACYALFLVTERGITNSDVGNLLPLALLGLIWLLVAVTSFRSILRDRSLLSDGEVAIGTVTSQSYIGGKNRASRIVYEFKDVAGRTFSGKGDDRTGKLFEEMQTPVFYDPTNPAKNVALAAASYDVVGS
jgi:hypothetical protein